VNTPNGHLTYCTNIHPGESWVDHFAALRQHIPEVKKRVSAHKPFGIGLRLSDLASRELAKKENLDQFIQWLKAENCYVFTMNGFPYGGFHRTKVKDHVHSPDWTTFNRVEYTNRLFDILSALLPPGMEGGVSTSPLSYRLWHTEDKKSSVFEITTRHVLHVVEHLIKLKRKTGQSMHLDLEPEPSGLIENGPEFIGWYTGILIPEGIKFLHERTGLDPDKAAAAIKEHIQLCYDVCHFAVGYEDHASTVKQLRELGIKTGKIQISAALKAPMASTISDREPVIASFRKFNESTYLHQVIARQEDGSLLRYPDLPEALSDTGNKSVREWRSHFHVPLFVKDYGVLQSTQSDIEDVLALHKKQAFTSHLEIETYTWEVLPDALRLPMTDSIVRELEWVISCLQET
jgi:hypothetical protein